MHPVKFVFLIIIGHVIAVNNGENICSDVKAATCCAKIRPLENGQKKPAELTPPTKQKNRSRKYELQILKKQNENFSIHNNELGESIGQLNATVQTLRENISKIERYVDQQWNSEIEKTELRLQQKYDINCGESLKRQIKIDQLEKEIKTLKSRNERLNISLSSNKQKIEDLKSQLDVKNKALHEFQVKPKKFDKFTYCNNLSTGIHDIEIDEISSITARCNNDIAGGNWMVILNRFDGSENFTRSWNEFRMGFGNLNGEFFIGLDHLHRITNSQQFELYVEYKYFDGIKGFARYDNFRIGNENTGYVLKSLGAFYGSNIDDLMTSNNLNQKFTTYDKDNNKDYRNCAQTFKGAWWFGFCRGPNPLAQYSRNARSSELSSMSWNGFNPIRSILMLIRPKQ
ncbi:ficolin-2-like isoform X1 [Drosophila willistoni]|uniref:ficolin-2-like isoform X1 n=2 Tax=Drosophila willistoni TaxID=7260 RepID=UPI001F076B21|nr:ficolin-2-like isoform X1 [Drosophila willistoni]